MLISVHKEEDAVYAPSLAQHRVNVCRSKDWLYQTWTFTFHFVGNCLRQARQGTLKCFGV
jgi:hypothetical protein